VHIDTDGQSASYLNSHWGQYNPTFPILTGCQGLFSSWGQGYIPHNTILDTDGVVRGNWVGWDANVSQQMHSTIQQYISLPYPFFTIDGAPIVVDDNGDGRPDPGETAELALSLLNSPVAEPATNVQVTLVCDNPHVTIINGSSSFPDADPGEVITSDLNFIFSVDSGFETDWAEFVFTYTADYVGGSVERDMSYDQRLGRPVLLLVDSDGNLDPNENWGKDALDELGRDYDLWSGTYDGPLSEQEVLRYEHVIWLGGVNQSDLSAAEEAALASFMDQGGLMVFSSQYASDDPSHAGFFSQYFDVTVTDTDLGNTFVAENETADPWFGDLGLVLTGSMAANNNEEPDQIALGGDAGLVAEWQQGVEEPAAAYLIGQDYNAVFAGFPIEAARTHGDLPNSVTLAGFLERVFTFHEENQNQPPPEPVDDLSITYATDFIFLSWTAVDGVTHYSVYESEDPYDFSGPPIADTSVTFIQLSFVPSPRKFYQVTAHH